MSLPPPEERSLPPIDPADPLAVQPQVQEIDTELDKANGLDKCPKCGSTEITLRPSEGLLICLFCRHQWSEANAEQAYGLDTAIHELSGTVVGTGARNIAEDFPTMITLKCAGCGAEVVVNTESSTQARCHWCRQTLSIHEQIPNGTVPDAILPFSLTRDEAVQKIKDFAGKRRMFAHGKFKREFKPENVIGVYMPYMVIDGNLHARVEGVGEVHLRSYTRGTKDNKKTYYDADVYEVGRDFDLTVDDLQVESSEARSNMNVSVNTNNIINTILPFDTKNAVKFNANYMRDFTSEKRDINVAQMKPRVLDQFLSIARARATEDAPQYHRRGIRWEREHVDVKGSRWIAVYLPVWLYSYYETKGNAHYVHYIAVNGRTGETMGSVPVNKVKLGLASLAIGVAGFLLGLTLMATGGDEGVEVSTYEGPDTSYSEPYDPMADGSRF